MVEAALSTSSSEIPGDVRIARSGERPFGQSGMDHKARE